MVLCGPRWASQQLHHSNEFNLLVGWSRGVHWAVLLLYSYDYRLPRCQHIITPRAGEWTLVENVTSLTKPVWLSGLVLPILSLGTYKLRRMEAR